LRASARFGAPTAGGFSLAVSGEGCKTCGLAFAPVGVDGHPSPEDCVSGGRMYRRGEMTGVWIAAALLFGAVVVILMVAMRS
jgi:hypothetical protein